MPLKVRPVGKGVALEEEHLADRLRRADQHRAEGAQLEAHYAAVPTANGVEALPGIGGVRRQQVQVAEHWQAE